MTLRTIFIGGMLILLVGCQADHHARKVRAASTEDRLTLGTVQKEIRKGMSGADVASALGSPNVVTTDDEGREVWIYDKIATEVVTSQTAGTLILFWGSSGAASKSQRTLTVVVKFDEQKRVRDFAYHASRF